MSHYLAAAMAVLALATLALGAWDLTAALYTQGALQAAVLEVQPYAAAAGGVDAAVHERLRQSLAGHGLDPGRAEVDGTPPGAPRGQEVELVVRYRAHLIGGAVELAATARVPSVRGEGR